MRYVYSLANKPTIWACDFFNEPDYSANNEGSPADIFNVLYYMTNNATCRNFKMGGLGTLNADVALNWFNPLVGRATLGSTHWLADSSRGEPDSQIDSPGASRGGAGRTAGAAAGSGGVTRARSALQNGVNTV